jgi:hypothetical protein
VRVDGTKKKSYLRYINLLNKVFLAIHIGLIFATRKINNGQKGPVSIIKFVFGAVSGVLIRIGLISFE